MRLDNLCSYLRTTTSMEHSPIGELIIRKEEGGVQHEFLLILLYKPSGGELWMRLERKKPLGSLGRLVSGIFGANDIVSALIDDWIVTEPQLTGRQLFPGSSILC